MIQSEYTQKALTVEEAVSYRFFTLIEILVVSSMIVVIGGILYLSVRPALAKSLAEKEIGQVRQFVELAQAGAVFSGIGSKLTVTKEENAIKVRFQSDFPLDAKNVKEGEVLLKQVHMVRYLPKDSKQGALGLQELTFLPDGTLKEGEGWLQFSLSSSDEQSSSSYLKVAAHLFPKIARSFPEGEKEEEGISAQNVYQTLLRAFQ